MIVLSRLFNDLFLYGPKAAFRLTSSNALVHIKNVELVRGFINTKKKCCSDDLLLTCVRNTGEIVGSDCKFSCGDFEQSHWQSYRQL